MKTLTTTVYNSDANAAKQSNLEGGAKATLACGAHSAVSTITTMATL